MPRVQDTNARRKRAPRKIRKKYDTIKSAVTKRSVMFPALGVAVFTAILLAVVIGQTYYKMAAVFVTVFAVLSTTRELRGREPDLPIVISEDSRTPIHESARVSKILDPTEEQFEWEGREHILSLLDIRPGWQWMQKALDSKGLWRLWAPGAFVLVVMVGVFALTRSLWLGLVALLIIGIALRLGEWHRRYLVFTTRRFVALRGLASPRELQVPLNMMTSVTIRTPWHSKLLKFLGIIRSEYGTLLITAPGEHNAELNETPWVPNIQSVRANLTHLVLTLQKQ